MADDAPKLDPEVERVLAHDRADRWAIALERLAKYDENSLDAETVFAEFKAAVGAREQG